MLRGAAIVFGLAAYGVAARLTYVMWWLPRHTISADGSFQQVNMHIFVPLLVTCLLVAAGCTYVACSQNIYRIKEGEVVKRSYQAPYDRTFIEGGITVGGASTGVPIDGGAMHIGGRTYGGMNLAGGEKKTERVPARYRLKLRHPQTGHKGWVVVSEAAYRTHPEGSYYSA